MPDFSSTGPICGVVTTNPRRSCARTRHICERIVDHRVIVARRLYDSICIVASTCRREAKMEHALFLFYDCLWYLCLVGDVSLSYDSRAINILSLVPFLLYSVYKKFNESHTTVVELSRDSRIIISLIYISSRVRTTLQVCGEWNLVPTWPNTNTNVTKSAHILNRFGYYRE